MEITYITWYRVHQGIVQMKIVKLIKSVTARRKFAEHPEVKKILWGGELLSDDYSVESVGLFSCNNVIAEYLKEHGLEKEYRQLVLNLPCR